MRRLGKVLKSNGTDGEVVLSLLDVVPEEIDLEEPVFIYDDGLPVPYFMSGLRTRGNSRCLVHLTGVTSLADADELAGREVWAEDAEPDEEALEQWLAGEDESDEDVLAALEGWTVLSETGARVGTVSGGEPIPGNLCIYVATPAGDNVLLPLHEDLVVRLDPAATTLVLRIPEGLV